MQSYDIVFETSRFNASEPKDYFINPCCFGDDCAAWLRGELQEKRVETRVPGQEDWGWYLQVKFEGNAYFLGIGATPKATSSDPDMAEWRIIVQKRRSLWDRIAGRRRMTECENILRVIEQTLAGKPDFNNVRLEHLDR